MQKLANVQLAGLCFKLGWVDVDVQSIPSWAWIPYFKTLVHLAHSRMWRRYAFADNISGFALLKCLRETDFKLSSLCTYCRVVQKLIRFVRWLSSPGF